MADNDTEALARLQAQFPDAERAALQLALARSGGAWPTAHRDWWRGRRVRDNAVGVFPRAAVCPQERS